MDLDLIITHLDNFVDTWKGWGNVVEGLKDVLGYNFTDLIGLSSKFDDAGAQLVETSSKIELSSGLINIDEAAGE
ncbi:hypothetical protein [uncultured Corynebacterium sp.]|uniref:hypothetical protein n=1 Tax=uncultured Corynebacterium sp. TaxID=159447 RepID=UPI002598AAF1|nr:hypothetical protein [uncultured Corynebacterium sp.]